MTLSHQWSIKVNIMGFYHFIKLCKRMLSTPLIGDESLSIKVGLSLQQEQWLNKPIGSTLLKGIESTKKSKKKRNKSWFRKFTNNGTSSRQSWITPSPRLSRRPSKIIWSLGSLELKRMFWLLWMRVKMTIKRRHRFLKPLLLKSTTLS